MKPLHFTKRNIANCYYKDSQLGIVCLQQFNTEKNEVPDCLKCEYNNRSIKKKRQHNNSKKVRLKLKGIKVYYLKQKDE